jgi:hypothetical protein
MSFMLGIFSICQQLYCEHEQVIFSSPQFEDTWLVFFVKVKQLWVVCFYLDEEWVAIHMQLPVW